MPEVGQFIQAQDVDTRQSKNGASHDNARGRTDGLDHDVLLQDVLLAQTGGDANGQNRNGDGCLKYLADFQAQIGRRGRKYDGKNDAHHERIACHFGHDARSRHHRHILLTRLQLAISVFGQTSAATADVHGDLHLGVQKGNESKIGLLPRWRTLTSCGESNKEIMGHFRPQFRPLRPLPCPGPPHSPYFRLQIIIRIPQLR